MVILHHQFYYLSQSILTIKYNHDQYVIIYKTINDNYYFLNRCNILFEIKNTNMINVICNTSNKILYVIDHIIWIDICDSEDKNIIRQNFDKLSNLLIVHH